MPPQQVQVLQQHVYCTQNNALHLSPCRTSLSRASARSDLPLASVPEASVRPRLALCVSPAASFRSLLSSNSPYHCAHFLKLLAYISINLTLILHASSPFAAHAGLTRRLSLLHGNEGDVVNARTTCMCKLLRISYPPVSMTQRKRQSAPGIITHT